MQAAIKSKDQSLFPVVDISEDEIQSKYPGVLELLLFDNTTQQSIIWGTQNYEYLGEKYSHNAQIFTELITGENGNLIMPRIEKNKFLQQGRVKNMAEVFTPAWVCNAQNNLVDSAWFERENVFNTELTLPNGTRSWKTNAQKITFPNGKNWEQYVKDKRLEITCGEAPYIVSRYDATTGEHIPIKNRIGLLDRKLRVIHENTEQPKDWLDAAQDAFQSTYAYEWQGDSLLLAREAMLFTFIENYTFKFSDDPCLDSVQSIAKIISWNAWQMDGLKGVVPYSCQTKQSVSTNLFGEQDTKKNLCMGCSKENIFRHSGTYCVIKDWSAKKKVRFVDLLKQ